MLQTTIKCSAFYTTILDKRLNCRCGTQRGAPLLKIRGKHPVVTKFATSYSGSNVAPSWRPCRKDRRSKGRCRRGTLRE